MISGIRSAVPPSNGVPSRVPSVLDHRVVAVLCAAVLDRGEGRVLVAQLLDDLVDLGVVDGLDLGPEVEVPVVAEGDVGPDLDGRLEDERLALLGLDDLDVGVRQRQDRLLDERVAIGGLDEAVDGFVEDGAGAEDASSTRPRALCRAGSRGRASASRGPGRPRRRRDRGARPGPRPRGSTELLGAGVAVTFIAGEA